MRQLEIEDFSLQFDGETAPDCLLITAQDWMAATRKKYAPIFKLHEEKMDVVQLISEAEQKLESLGQLLEKSKREGDLQIALDLEYYAIPETRDRHSYLQNQHRERYPDSNPRHSHDDEALFPASVISETIYDIVSKRTRIEVSVLKPLTNLEPWI